jgi:hypothetical protein
MSGGHSYFINISHKPFDASNWSHCHASLAIGKVKLH